MIIYDKFVLKEVYMSLAVLSW